MACPWFFWKRSGCKYTPKLCSCGVRVEGWSWSMYPAARMLVLHYFRCCITEPVIFLISASWKQVRANWMFSYWRIFMTCMVRLRTPDAVHYTAPHIISTMFKDSHSFREYILLHRTEHLADRCSLNHSIALFARSLFLTPIVRNKWERHRTPIW